MKKQKSKKPLTEEEMDEIAISQVDDEDAWEEPFEVAPILRSRVIGDPNPPAKHPAGRPQHR